MDNKNINSEKSESGKDTDREKSTPVKLIPDTAMQSQEHQNSQEKDHQLLAGFRDLYNDPDFIAEKKKNSHRVHWTDRMKVHFQNSQEENFLRF
ncbi:MAG: hypothetical protein R3A12_00280 [Ignavibacteria bacterium]